ncbi:MAG: hypothetical protein ABJA79_07335, partial [Parafilimonas sp.]
KNILFPPYQLVILLRNWGIIYKFHGLRTRTEAPNKWFSAMLAEEYILIFLSLFRKIFMGKS